MNAIQQVKHEAEICRNNYNACILRLEWAYDTIRKLQDEVNQLEGEVALAEINIDDKETEIFNLRKHFKSLGVKIGDIGDLD